MSRASAFLSIYGQGLRVGYGEFRNFWSWKTWLACWMLRITTQGSAWVLLGALLGSPGKMEFLMVGNAIAGGIVAIGFVVAASTWDRWDGTYPLMVIAPSGLLPSTLGRTSIWLLNAIVTVLATFAFFALAFGWRAPLGAVAWLPLFVAVICLSAFGFSLFLGALITRFQTWRNIVHNAVATATMAFCGVNVPLDFWPPWVRAAAQCVPVTHGLQALRLCLHGGEVRAIASGLLAEAGVGIGWFALAALFIDRLANGGRADGSIEFT